MLGDCYGGHWLYMPIFDRYIDHTGVPAKRLWGYRESKNRICGAATCDLNHTVTSCTHFGERPSVDDFAVGESVTDSGMITHFFRLAFSWSL